MHKSIRELQADNERLNLQNGLLLRYLYDHENNVQPDTTTYHQFNGPGTGFLHGALYRAKAGDGGYVVISSKLTTGVRPDPRIYLLDEINARLRNSHSELTVTLRIVLEHLTRKRDELSK